MKTIAVATFINLTAIGISLAGVRRPCAIRIYALACAIGITALWMFLAAMEWGARVRERQVCGGGMNPIK